MESTVGRPTAYQDTFAAQAEKLCRLGATDSEIADFFDVSTRTVYRWKLDHEDFCQALKAGKEEADARVERGLFQKATGFEYVEEQAIKVKLGPNEERIEVVEVRRYSPTDTTAAIFWLKNRRSADWRDKVETVHSGSVELTSKEQRDAAVAAATRADR